MAKTWFVGAKEAVLPPTQPGDRLIPLSAIARTLIPGGGDSALDVAAVELQAGPSVLQDLANFVALTRSRVSGAGWFQYGDHDLSSAFRRADEAVAGFANQRTAFESALASASTGPFEAWGADAFQLAGLRAALGPVGSSPGVVAGGGARLRLPPRFLRKRVATSEERSDILYLSLEPHVARQQDRVLDLLSENRRIAAVSLQRSPWPWPGGTKFTVREHPSLISYLKPIDILKGAGAWTSRRILGPGPAPFPRWMPAQDAAPWLRSTWLRAASVTEALVRAIQAHKPRLLLGTNLASGMGTVISKCAAHHGLAVLSLPTGADYLLPPQFDPADVGGTTFVVPGEGIAARLREAGVPAERLLALGWPEIDGIASVRSSEVERFREEFGLDARRPLAVFFSSPSSASDGLVVPAQAKSRALQLLAEACRLEGFQLAVKLHPREGDGAIERLAANLNPVPLVFSDRLPVLLHVANVVASVGSAVSFAGVALGKVTVILESESIGPTAALFRSVGVGSQPRSLEELSAFLRSAASPSISHEGDSLWKADGKVAERIRSAVDRLLG